MSVTPLRTAGAVFLLGLLVVWLITPIGNACPDVGKLPSGSRGESAPSFAPPLTRTCTYTTPEGTKARKRYVPVVDVLALALVAALVGGGIALAGPGGAPRPPREPKPPRHEPGAAGPELTRSERDEAGRQRARAERAARRRG
jgi:hypothetical protein